MSRVARLLEDWSTNAVTGWDAGAAGTPKLDAGARGGAAEADIEKEQMGGAGSSLPLALSTLRCVQDTRFHISRARCASNARR
jgi:hypothetical protein